MLNKPCNLLFLDEIVLVFLSGLDTGRDSDVLYDDKILKALSGSKSVAFDQLSPQWWTLTGQVCARD